MSTKRTTVSFEFRAPPREQATAQAEGDGEEYLIVLLGDFSGRTKRGLREPLSTRRLVRIDPDNCERVCTQLDARLTLSELGPAFPEGTINLSPTKLEDFHPDSLLTKVPRLAYLMTARQQLQNPKTAESGRAALEALLGSSNLAPTSASSPAPTKTATESDNDTLSRLLGGSPPTSPAPTPPSSQAAQLIQQIVAPHVAQSPASWQAGALAAAQLELSRGLAAILHHPQFQSLEAAWRSLDLLVRRIESDSIKLCLLDVAPDELQSDLQSGPTQSGLFSLLRQGRPALLVGAFSFGRNADELRVLTGLAQIAAQLDAPFIATAAPALVGCPSFAAAPDSDAWTVPLSSEADDLWQALRRSPAAHFCGLAAPRFLLRQPYGKSGDAIESFAFEEMPGAPVHDAFLWGEAGILCCCAVLDGLQTGGLAVSEISGGEVADLPMHQFTEHGEMAVQPYAEIWLTDRAIERMHQRGVTPLVSLKNSNTIRLPSLRSVASPPTQLFGQ